MNALINTHYSAFNSPRTGEILSLQPSAEESLKPHGQQTSFLQSNFLQGVLEAMMDGVLVVTDTGKLIYANRYARQFCLHWLQEVDRASSSLEKRANLVPKPVWKICKALIENRDFSSQSALILEDEIGRDSAQSIRVRVRWIDLDAHHRPCLLITLEDRSRSSQDMAIAEAQKYGLTEREAEVWQLRRANFTYKAIALQLHIAVDTVKKHLKSVHAKRQAFLWQQE